MPIVAVELDDQIVRRNKGVNAKLTADDMLRLVVDAQTVEQTVTDPLYTCLYAALLLGVHLNQSGVLIWISIAALWRTVQDVAELLKRRRFAKCLATHLASVCEFVLSLPLVSVIRRAKITGLAEPVLGDVNQYAADGAWVLFPSPWFRSLVLHCTDICAVFNAFLHPLGDGNTASRAGDGSESINMCFHMAIIQQDAAQSKPVVLPAWFLCSLAAGLTCERQG